MLLTGNSNYDDPAAADFLADFTADPGEVSLIEALAPAADAGDDDETLDADVAAPALAAAELVAALAGEPFAGFPAALLTQLDELDVSDLDELLALARAAVTAAAQNSETRAQAAAASTLNDWLEQQQALLKRLT